MCDIKAMFHQVLVNEKDRSLLRLLWWEDHNINNNIVDFYMGVYVFGGTSLPSCCNYALKRKALDNEEKYQKKVTDTLRRNLYVDDLLTSVRDVNTAICLLHKVIKLCAEGGFWLTKFVSIKVEVLQSIPKADRRDGLMNIDINSGSDLPTERALGINRDIENGKLGFKLNLGDKPYTRKRRLPMISKIYDSLGLASPFLLKGKRILQEICKNNISWDEQMSAETIEEWEKWKNDLKLLRNINLDRCLKRPRFGRLIDCSLHHFSDASQDGYCQVPYLKLLDEGVHIHCSLVMSKSRVTPLKFVSIPRLELTAAALSIKVSLLLKKELTVSTLIREFYWTDSRVVLGYIRNEAKRFKVLWQTDSNSSEKIQM